MGVLDDQGRILGLINVVDALVLLLVVVIVIAGVSFVIQTDPEPSEPTEPVPEIASVTAVLDLGSLPEYVANRIDEGDFYSPVENSNLTVSDVYVAPQGDAVRTLLSVELQGPVTNDSIIYDGAPPRLGRQLTLRTDDYRVTGNLRALGDGTVRQTVPVLVSQTVDGSTVSAIQTGDSYTVAGYRVATVESVEVFATDDPEQRRVFLGLSLRTVDVGNGPQFGGTPVRRGVTLSFQTDDYELAGSVERVGSAQLPGEPSSREVTLELEGVRPALAASLGPGLSERIHGQTNADVVAVETRPEPSLVTTNDGRIIVGEHPNRMRVTLTTELAVRETATGPTFKGRHLQLGQTVPLDLGVATIEATVVEIGDRTT